MQGATAIDSVLATFGTAYRPLGIEELGGAGGLSGAALWRLQAEAGSFCLKVWPPEHPNAARLRFVHELLAHVWDRGFRKVPVPVRNRAGESFVRVGGRFWELSPWMPGRADFHERPADARLRRALEALARFHQCAADFPEPTDPQVRAAVRLEGVGGNSAQPSPGIVERREMLHRWLAGRLDALAERIVARPRPEFEQRARRLVALFREAAPAMLPELRDAERLGACLQPCIRDVRHDHVLFSGDEVAALLDFGSARYESVAADIARLLGELVGDERDRWAVGLDAYKQVRPLGTADLRLVRVFDRSSVLLGGMLWLKWIYLEGRTFERLDTVLARLDDHVERLKGLAKGR